MAEVTLGFFEQCPVCHHHTYYPFSDGWMCIQPGCEHSGDKPEEGVQPDRVIQAAQLEETTPVEQPLTKNQRRKANKRLREAGGYVSQHTISAQRDTSGGATTGESANELDT